MSRISLSSVLLVACVGGAVASAGVVGTYAVVAPLVASANTSATAAAAQPVVSGTLPVWLKKNANGVLAPATQAVITLVQNGAIVTESPVDPGGTANIGGLQTGIYSIFVNGPDGFAAFGSWLQPGVSPPVGPGSKIDVALVPGSDMPVVGRILQEYLAAGPGAAPPSYPPPPPGQLGPSAGYDRRELIQGQGFELDATGTVHGKILASAPPTEPDIPLAGLDVFFIHGGQIVGEARTGADGVFHTSGLKPGVHSFVAAGPGAFLALAAPVHPAAPTAGTEVPITEFTFGKSDETQPVSVEDGEAAEGVALNQAPVTTVAQASPVNPQDLGLLMGGMGMGPNNGLFPPPPPFGGGGGGFGGGGGGFGGGGGGLFDGGLGALLGLAGLGLAAAALADDDNNNQPPIIVSPAVP